jgi:predicted nucleotidyltransferase
MTPIQQSILDEIAVWAANYPCIKAMHVYGSIARNEAKETSDIDIAFEYVPNVDSDSAMVACYTKVNAEWDNLAALLKNKFGHQPKRTGLSPFADAYDHKAWTAIRVGREIGRIGKVRLTWTAPYKLTGETKDNVASLVGRAGELISQLGIAAAAETSIGISPKEVADTIVRTLCLPEIQNIRSRLLPEIPVYGHERKEDKEILVSGVSDAVAVGPNRGIEVVVDWKSDVELPPGRLNAYRGQIDAYRKNTGAARALLVLMTSGQVIEVT